jgi:hypothetical protein
MTVTTSAGSTLGISALAPPTYDLPGFYAVGFTLIGEITNVGEFGRSADKVEHKPLANRGTIKKKGGYDDGVMALTIGCDESDIGQIALEAVTSSDGPAYFALVRQDGTIHFFGALAFSFKRSVGERNNITNVTSSLEIVTPVLKGTLDGLLDFARSEGLVAAMFTGLL